MRLPGDSEALLKDAKVVRSSSRRSRSTARQFKGFEAIQDFALIAKDFTTDNGMLTPSLKLKRRKVVEAHGSLIDGLYAKRAEKKGPSASAARA